MTNVSETWFCSSRVLYRVFSFTQAFLEHWTEPLHSSRSPQVMGGVSQASPDLSMSLPQNLSPQETQVLTDSAPLSLQVCFHLQRTQPHLQGPEADGVHLLLLQNPGSERSRGGTFLRNVHLQHNQKCPSHPQRCVEVDLALWGGERCTDVTPAKFRSDHNIFWISLVTRWNQNFSKKKKKLCVVGYLK